MREGWHINGVDKDGRERGGIGGKKECKEREKREGVHKRVRRARKRMEKESLKKNIYKEFGE